MLASICLTVFTLTNADGFDLKELKDIEITDDSITTDLSKLEMIKYAISLNQRVFGTKRSLVNPLRYLIGKYITPPEEPSEWFLPRVAFTYTEQMKRERPQYVISYHQQLNSIVLFFIGTDFRAEGYDYANLNNVVPKKVEFFKHHGLKLHDKRWIEVHGGIYKAVNTVWLFKGNDEYEGGSSLLDDLEDMIDRVYAENDEDTMPIKKLYITGHSQGGAIATLFTILFQGRGSCDFVKYFENNGTPELLRLMKGAEVITYGAVSIFGNTNYGADFIDQKYHDKILNIINPMDWIPMVFTGTVERPVTSLEENDDTSIDLLEIFAHQRMQAFGDNADDIEWYGPAGTYMAILRINGQPMLKRLDREPDPDNLHLFDNHLVHGTRMLKSFGFNQINAFLLLLKYHMAGTYASLLSDCVEYHRNEISNPKYIFPKK